MVDIWSKGSKVYGFALKGVFAKTERGYIRLRRKLLLFVASVRRKLLKTTHAEERRVHTNSESCSIQLGS